MKIRSESAATFDKQALPDAYTNSAPCASETHYLEERVDVDTAVIGAGITGCSAALHMALAGRSVVQLEAGEISGGGSGRAFGLVVPYGKHDEFHILRHFGPELGERHLATLAEGPALVRELMKQHDITIAMQDEGWVLAAHTGNAAEQLHRRAAFWQARMADVEIVQGNSLHDVIGSDYYSLGLKDSRAFAINPYLFTLGLARGARNAGVKQYTHTAALDFRQQCQGWEVATPRGIVCAKTLLICTNAYTGDLSPKLKRAFVPIRGYQAVSEPIPERLIRQILPGTGVITDTRHTWSGIKKLHGNRLHLSTGGPALSGTRSADLRYATTRLRKVFPAVAETGWESSWSGWVSMTPDQFPRIGRLGENAWTGYGYNGRGLAAATLMGRELARVALGATEYRPFVPVHDLRPLPLHVLGKYVASAMISWFQFKETVT